MTVGTAGAVPMPPTYEPPELYDVYVPPELVEPPVFKAGVGVGVGVGELEGDDPAAPV